MRIRHVRNPFNYDRDQVSRDTSLICSDSSLAQQQFRDDCDINTILRRFNVTGQLPVGSVQPQYGDFSGIFDYRTALDAVRAAQESFDALPAKVRSRFANDPAAFVDFCSDESNREEMKALGLLIEKAASAAEKSPTEPDKGEAAQ